MIPEPPSLSGPLIILLWMMCLASLVLMAALAYWGYTHA